MGGGGVVAPGGSLVQGAVQCRAATVYTQLTSFLEWRNILEIFCLVSKHSTESVILTLSNDIFLSTDSGECIVLMLLALTAAFDRIDDEILLSRLWSTGWA